ncbi:MAG: reverse transcriptase domain-containing protein [Candidatus Thiodiazotropha endolucinida]|nr:endonuclease/exonuclease/phosphatase family protein [Candidatus Thiodiazotropha taylori]MCW4342926.1 reverse transcriptase domain-containing protein [Candidatus Thiodiazotropha endolucinida]
MTQANNDDVNGDPVYARMRDRNTSSNSIKLSCIKIAHSNINGIRNKLEHIEAELDEHDVLCISETKLNDSIETKALELNGYTIAARKDRNINNGGGLLIYTKRNIALKRRTDLEVDNIENIWIEIHSLKTKFLLGHFYRPPNSTVDYWDNFENNIERASDQNCDMIIVGDLNHDILSKTISNSHLLRIMSKFNLENLIHEPTRITDTSQTCLDLIITNHTSIINNTEVLPPFQSDHSTIAAEITSKTYKTQSFKKTIWKYEEADIPAIENNLNAIDWSFIQNHENIDFINEKFTSTILGVAEKSIPQVKFTIRPNDKPWMTSSIRKHMRQRNRLYTKAKTKNSTYHWHNYKNKRNEVVQLVREAKRNYMTSLQSTLSDPNLPSRKWFKIANDITKLKNKANPPPPLLSNAQVNIHPLDKAQVLNEHFANISKTENEPILPQDLNHPKNLSALNITEQDVKDQLHILNEAKPGGSDELMPRMLKICRNQLVKPLTLLFNRSLELGVVPQQWKMSNISAIFKGKGNEQDPTNYRPISITSCLSKMLEKIIFKYLFNYLKEHEILTRYQSGFRPKDSTVTQLLEIYHIIIDNLDKGRDLKFVFCDVSKAFDKVWHQGLLFKLKRYGIYGNLLNWFNSYLSNRKQRVLNEGFKSTWLNTTAGVPQGSVLGPYLFLLYVNDIVDNLESNIRLFADDTTLFAVVENEDSVRILNDDLHKITKWADDWCVILNPNKTKSMTFTRKRETNWPHVKVNNTVLNDDRHHTHLGLTLSSDGTWNEHINAIYSKAAYRLNLLRMLKYDLDRNSLNRFYIAFIRPILEYGNIIWDNCTKQQGDLLESIQKDAARIVTGLRRGTSHETLYRELGWTLLSERRKNSKLIQFFKILNNEAPIYIDDILSKFNEHQSTYSLRNQQLKHPIPRTTSYKNSFFLSTTDLWNSLDNDLANATSLYAFKKALKDKTPKPPKHFTYGERKYNIILCQLRNHKSQLEFDLFNDHLSENFICTCGAIETRHHYLLECPMFVEQRNELMNSLVSHPEIYGTIAINDTELVCGNTNLPVSLNKILYDYVINYIRKTGRL